MAHRGGVSLKLERVIKAGLNKPHDVICHRGRYVITDKDNNTIVSVTPESGNFRNLAHGNTGFHPYGIVAVSEAEDHFLVTDAGEKNSAGYIYEVRKGTLSRWAVGYRSFGSPTGIAICEKEVFVADWSHGCIHVFTLTGEIKRCLAMGKLTNPWFLAFNSQKQLYVADLYSIKVIHRYEDIFEDDFEISTCNKKWHYRGIAIDDQDNVYITARSTDSRRLFTKETLTVLDKDHRVLDNFTGGWRTFNYLRGLCFDAQHQRVVVVDGEWHELKIFSVN
ncbi:uncharacterized protein LOC121406452 [Lytechinus variegatus]|uniref:uncharacterized protein LOC121406452 n=1 Tax=Lytechinus variegatus TaxID=7654 RepID=UPI001BB1EDDE|nr:uncharacterized protein LOC121406452 [Lytechinus variegatus]